MIDNKDIYLDAIKTFGVKNQREMMIEECSEITKTIQKLKRLEDDVIKGRLKPKSAIFKNKQERLQKDFVSELVDVEIVLNQLKKVISKDFYEQSKKIKLNRLHSLINDEILRKNKLEQQTLIKNEIVVNKIRNGVKTKIKRPNGIRSQMKKMYIKNKEAEKKNK